MNTSDIESALCAAERSLTAGSGLAGTGFWKAVDAVKRDPALVETYADRISEIDRQAFEAWVLLSVPVAVGTSLLGLGTLAGLGLIGWGYAVDSPVNGVLLLAGTGVVLVSTHGLAHLAVGWVVGMRFTHWFIPRFTRPQPGVKVDYATYLRVPPMKRAWMHAAGAVVGKLIPFLAIPAALAMDAPGWTVGLLVVGGVAQVVIDVVWSTKAADWKKVRREMQYVDSSRSG